MKSMEYQDFKYIMNDISKCYIGTKLTYGEAMQHDYMPFKLKAIYKSYFKLASDEDTIAEHLLRVTDDSLDYLALQNIGAKVKINVWSSVTDKHGNVTEKWLPEQILPIDQYVKEESYHLYPDSAIVTELILNKIKLMTFSV